MTDSKQQQPRPDRPHSGAPGKRSPGRRIAILGGVGALGLALALAIPVWARHGSHGHGWLGDGEFLEFMIERKLRHLDATETQREQILAITGDTRDAILALRDAGSSPREAFVDQLVSDPTHRAELEALRVEQLARMDEGSRILVEAIAQIGAILTPQQRAELAAMHRSRHERWHR